MNPVGRETLDAMIAEAAEAAEGTQGADKDMADKRLADTKALGDLLAI